MSSLSSTPACAHGRAVLRQRKLANQPLLAMVGANSFNTPQLTNADYLELVDFIGRVISPGKRGRIRETEPKALTKLGLDPRHWSAKVKGIGSGYWRVVAEVEDLIDLATQLKQRTLFWDWFCTQISTRLILFGRIPPAAFAAGGIGVF